MLVRLSIYIGLLFSSIVATAAEYQLPFHRAQAWAEFFVIELNEGVSQVMIDGHWDKTSYQLPATKNCLIEKLFYRPVMPMGQIYLNYISNCDGERTVHLTKVEKVGTVLKTLMHQQYGQPPLGAGFWQDDQIVVTALGAIFVYDFSTGQKVFSQSDLNQSHNALWFSKVVPNKSGFEFTAYPNDDTWDTLKLCLNWTTKQLSHCSVK